MTTLLALAPEGKRPTWTIRRDGRLLYRTTVEHKARRVLDAKADAIAEREDATVIVRWPRMDDPATLVEATVTAADAIARREAMDEWRTRALAVGKVDARARRSDPDAMD